MVLTPKLISTVGLASMAYNALEGRHNAFGLVR